MPIFQSGLKICRYASYSIPEKYGSSYIAKVSIQHLPVIVDHYGVAFAGDGFETRAIEDMDVTATVTDKTAVLQHACGDGDAASTHTQHAGQEFMSKMKLIGARAIMHHE
jgi:hypothetical protein